MSDIISIARLTRRWALRTRLRYGFGNKLTGMCAIASFRLSENLEKHGIKHELVMTHTHVWIQVNGHALDITATQFGHPPIVYMPIRDYWINVAIPAKIDKQTTRTYKDRADLRAYMVKKRWKSDQLPLR